MIGTLSMLRFFAWNPLDHACLVSGWKRWSIGVWANSLNLARLMSNVRQWWHVRALFAELSCSYLQDARPQTVLVENPKTLDEKGKLVTIIRFLSQPSQQVNYELSIWLDCFVCPGPDPGEQCRRWCHLMEKMTKNSSAASSQGSTDKPLVMDM